MICSVNKEVKLYYFQKSFQNKLVKHFVTSRQGGVSSGDYASLNIGFGTDDFSLSVLENRHLLADATEIPIDFFVMCNQVHGNRVQVITREHRGKGAMYKDNSIIATDAMVSNIPEICLFVMSADCVPILFFDPVKKVIGAAHAGWRGTVAKITFETVKAMVENYGCNPTDIQAGIGPSIGKCCYTVGGEVIDKVLNTFGTTENYIRFDNENSEPRFDLWYTNKKILLEAGLKEENIETAEICTQCNHNEFFSSRAGKGITGRFGAGIMIV